MTSLIDDASSYGRVLVTGAGGFIGARVVEQLVLGHGYNVRAMVHSPHGAVRVARLPVEIVAGDITDERDLRRSVSGCTSVIHCAYDAARPEANVAAARLLADICLSERVGRLVHLSSLSVYEPLTGSVVTEDSPRRDSGWTYQETKLHVEREFERWCDKGLPAVILQPTIVYGPFSGAWTVRIAEMLREGRPVLPNGGDGICNHVYIDDVVSAILAALNSEVALGQRLLISGEQPVTWRNFFEAFERCMATQSVTYASESLLAPSGRAGRVRSGVVQAARNPIEAITASSLAGKAKRIAKVAGPSRVAYLKKVLPRPYLYPDAQSIALYSSSAAVDISRAHSLLGYTPAFSFEAGMKLTASFVEWANL